MQQKTKLFVDRRTIVGTVQTCVPPSKRGRKKRLPPPTEEDRRNYHRTRLDNYHRSAARATSADRLMLEVLIDLTAPLSQ